MYKRQAYGMPKAIAPGKVLKTADEKDSIAVALGRRGGSKGGPARAVNMPTQQRGESDKRARDTHKGRKRTTPTLAELDARLAATRARRVKAAEKNGLNLIGRTRL